MFEHKLGQCLINLFEPNQFTRKKHSMKHTKTKSLKTEETYHDYSVMKHIIYSYEPYSFVHIVVPKKQKHVWNIHKDILNHPKNQTLCTKIELYATIPKTKSYAPRQSCMQLSQKPKAMHQISLWSLSALLQSSYVTVLPKLFSLFPSVIFVILFRIFFFGHPTCL